MRSRLITNLILLTIVIVLVMATLIELKPEKIAPTPISQLNSETISTIVLTRRGKPPLHFQKQKEGWFMFSPQKGKADPHKMEKLMAIARQNSSSHFPIDPEKTERFGLKEPAITLKLNTLSISVGGIAPISQQRYLRINEMLYLVTDNFYHHLIAQPEQYLATAVNAEK